MTVTARETDRSSDARPEHDPPAGGIMHSVRVYPAFRLLMLGTNLPENFTKRYGNTLPYNRFRDDVPAYESIDGGEYQLIGTANKILGDVKEGTVLTIHGEGDDNITFVQIGVPKNK